jgi:hypothetical protein
MFSKDLSFGKHYEARWSSQFSEYVAAPEGCFKPWDVTVGQEVYEVKADRLVGKYGNFFIEFECSGKPSGISTTTATHWILYDVRMNGTTLGEPLACYKVPLQDLRTLAPDFPIKAGGDGWRSKGWVVPAKELTQYQLSYIP